MTPDNVEYTIHSFAAGWCLADAGMNLDDVGEVVTKSLYRANRPLPPKHLLKAFVSTGRKVATKEYCQEFYRHFNNPTTETYDV